ncbi:hypothetical protein BsWGS_23260 [Bradybaena similaris]
MVCSDKNLQALPQLVYSNTSIQWSLDIDSNNISRIPGDSLPPNLTDLNLDGNPVATIDDTAFDASANTMVWLYFSNVRFTRIPNAIGHLRALIHFSMTGANITDWNSDVWRYIGNTLQTLDLEEVGMSVWPNWIQHFTNLTSFYIAQGTISSIPDGALDSVAHSLTTLSLNNNRLTMVPKALSNLSALQTLYLYENYIADVRWLPQNSKLNTLSFSYNYIWNCSQLSEILVPYSTSLNSFDIDNNRLSSLPDIPYLINARAFDFTHNRISDSISGTFAPNVFMLELSYNSFPYVPKLLSTLPELVDFALSYNVIRAIRETDFHNGTNTINLGYNLITELTDTSFPDNFGLEQLELNNNPLVRISPVALQHLPRLNYFDLRNTKITRLPLGLSHLASLYSIDFTDSVSLICTCMESSLTAWVLKLGPQNVLGNCGPTSVYDFFSILGPSCPSAAATAAPK